MYVVFDIGGTHTRIGTSRDLQTLLHVETINTPKNFQEAMGVFKHIVDKLASGEKIEVAAGGVRALDFTKTKLLNHPYFPLWVNEPLRDTLEEFWGAPVYLENDAALVGLGEATAGAGKGHKIVAYITISTGVGGARIVNGKIDVNTFGFEPGQQILNVNNDLYPYYNGLGYLESYISGIALEKRFKTKPSQLINPAVWNDVGKYLAIGLNNTIVHWSPSIVVLGGGMVNMIPLESVEFHLKAALKIFPVLPDLVKSQLGDQGGLIGALEFIKQHA